MVRTHRGWMSVIVPFPAWAMKESEIAQVPTGSNLSGNDAGNGQGMGFGLRLPEDV
jgi:hypothetical protein